MRNEELDYKTDPKIKAKMFVGIMLHSVISSENKGEPYSGQFPANKNFIEKLEAWITSLNGFEITDTQLEILKPNISDLISHHKIPWRTGTGFDFPIFSVLEVEGLITNIRNTYESLGGTDKELLPKNEDIPISFKGEVFLSYLEALAQETGNEQYLEFLIARIRTMLADSRMDSIIGDDIDIELDKWLEKYLGNGEKTSITIIDLSLVPAEIIHVTTAVISRIVFEALQRYRKLNEKTLPTVLIMEEAHSFITKYNDNNESNASSTCTKVFEKIAREGRKFGLGLVLSSQRPSELSPTVLSQCNSYILHRISNDRDQELVAKLLPDNFKGLLRELPSLPSQKAILLGWASELPILLKIRDLKKEHLPQSDDPDFWDVWTRKDTKGEEVKRDVDWEQIANDWQEKIVKEDEQELVSKIPEVIPKDDLPF